MSRVQTSRNSSLSLPFVLTEPSVKKLDEALGRFGDEVTYHVKCLDELEREFDLKRLLAYENAPKKAVRAITIRAETKDNLLRTASVVLRQSLFVTVTLDFRGPESEVEKLNDAIESVLSGMKPWYWWLAKYSIVLTVLGIGMVLGMLFTLVMLILRVSGYIPWGMGESTGSLGAVLFVCNVCILMTAALGLLDWFKSKVFPRATFAIGQGLNRFHVLEKI